MNNDIIFSDNPKINSALQKIEGCYDGVVLWLSNLYDPATAGYHMTVSGARDPEMQPAIEMTAWALSMLSGYTDLFPLMPDEIHRRTVAFFSERQDPVSGFFIDKQGITNGREQARNQAAALGAFRRLGAEPPYLHPSQSRSGSAKESVLMPEYMASVGSYVDWVCSLNWEKNSWGAGDQTQSSLQYLRMLPDSQMQKYRSALLDFLASRQLDSGLWSPHLNFNAVSGGFKVGLIYSALGERLPNYMRIVETTLNCYSADRTSSPFFVRNPLSLLRQIASYDDGASDSIRASLTESIDSVISSFDEFLCPDGAFSASKGKSMISFGGVVGSHGLFEGDIDATLMMLIARSELYRLLGLEPARLTLDGYWDMILGNIPTPPVGK